VSSEIDSYNACHLLTHLVTLLEYSNGSTRLMGIFIIQLIELTLTHLSLFILLV